ncbi:uncharacterized protein N7459_000453 [Penicillium hispanicum]|uniref:uncharacterized protein n=1 Tax=Penicillium hispanicum TaxID=1080232 RepID=UPI0025419BBB|nr:uncharacterized protein N7459_000453 [Penicillium hispanicum]KAJ5594245.1 hypothetical protein N7459_000453 [Penicillium hispanicum]
MDCNSNPQAHQLDSRLHKLFCWDRAHYDRLERSFSRPHLLSLQSASSQPWLTINMPNGTQERIPVTELTGHTCRSFFWRDCVIYINITSPQGRTPMPTYTDVTDHQNIFDAVYQHWFPTRDRQHDGLLHRGNFFASPVCYCPTEEQEFLSIPQMRNCHQMLCDQLKVHSQKGSISQSESQLSSVQRPSEKSSVAATFEKAFIVIDKLDWEDQGVLLVLSNSLASGDALLLENPTLKIVDKPCGNSVWRMALFDAMMTITRLSNDEQRMTPVRNESGFYEERFGNPRSSGGQLSIAELRYI